jgi:hypothetical protein
MRRNETIVAHVSVTTKEEIKLGTSFSFENSSLRAPLCPSMRNEERNHYSTTCVIYSFSKYSSAVSGRGSKPRRFLI